MVSRVEEVPSGDGSTSALGGCLAALKRYDEAEPLLSEGYATLKAKRGDADPRTQQALARLNNAKSQGQNNAKSQGRKESLGFLASLRLRVFALFDFPCAYHRARAFVSEDFVQQRVAPGAVYDVRAANASANKMSDGGDLRQHSR